VNLAVLRAQESKQYLPLLTPAQAEKVNNIQAAREARFRKRMARMANGSHQ
jgi:hypothetical protein